MESYKFAHDKKLHALVGLLISLFYVPLLWVTEPWIACAGTLSISIAAAIIKETRDHFQTGNYWSLADWVYTVGATLVGMTALGAFVKGG